MLHDIDRPALVIAAHPDDELLGCGGTVALLADKGKPVHNLIVCEGESLRYESSVGQDDAIQNAARILGVKEVHHVGLPDQKLDTLNLVDVISPIESIIRMIEPDLVLCQFGGDVNRDHELLFKAILVATRPTEKCIREVLAFDTASSTEWAYPRSFQPDTWVDVSSTLSRKLAAMACYKSELRDYPHPRSLKALEHRAYSWGNQHCLYAAEVFQTVRRNLDLA